MSLSVLVVNAGSSSLKLRVLDDDDSVTATADLPALRGGDSEAAALADTIASFGPVDAVGHRVVHGGTLYSRPVLLDGADGHVRRRLESLTDLAPLHQPKSLAALDAVSRILPDVPAVACFDTAFHATIPDAAATFALPPEWRTRWTLRRYGFHGLSHQYASRRAAELCRATHRESTHGRGTPGGTTRGGTTRDGATHDGTTRDGATRGRATRDGATRNGTAHGGASRIVTCHLGAGASLAAVLDGVSVDTTMGFTPLDGLVMATRSGSVDPGLVLWLAEHAHTPPAELAAALEHRSGLAGLAGTGDMREILSRAASADASGPGNATDASGPGGASGPGSPGDATNSGTPRDAGGTGNARNADAVLARDVYLHRLRGAIASMAAALGGLDALVFTGGVGENSPEIRRRAASGLAFLGVEIDPARNENPGNGSPGSRSPGRGNSGSKSPGSENPGTGNPGADDYEITADGAAARSFVIAAREDKQIAAGVRSVLSC